MPIETMMQCAKILTKALEKEDTQDQRELIIGTAAISAYASRLMHLKMKSWNTTKSVVFCKERLQNIYQHSLQSPTKY